MADLVLYNGRIHTQDPLIGEATAIAMKAGRIQAVGSDAEIKPLAESGARSIDLKGRRVIPGLVDAHFHFFDWALDRKRPSFSGVESLAGLVSRVASAARDLPAGDWLIGQGWTETDWPEHRLPSRDDLDQAAPDHPVLLWRSDLHMVAINSAALRAAGITAGTPNPPQGMIDKDASGRPTGILRDLAINLASNAVPSLPDEALAAIFTEGFASLHALGITGIHDQRLMGGDDGAPAFRAWQLLQTTRKLGLRVWMNLPGERLKEAIALGLRSGSGDEFFRIGHCKFFADGSQGARTAWMLEPYEDTGTKGLQLSSIPEIREALERAHNAGLAIAVHAIGDRTNHELAVAFEEFLAPRAGASVGRPWAPHRIEHMQLTQPEDLARMARAGVVASVQPLSVTDDISMMDQSIGSRSKNAFKFRSMLDAGIPLTFSSDCPVCDPNPFFSIHAAVTRRRRDGTPAEGWFPEQCLTVAESVWAFSMGAAIVSGRQHELGSLTPGKLADLVVTDLDIFSIDPMDIFKAKPVITVFHGAVVFETP